jgi:hypothetical protein
LDGLDDFMADNLTISGKNTEESVLYDKNVSLNSKIKKTHKILF